MQSCLLLWQQLVICESCKHSNNLRMSFFLTQKSVRRWGSWNFYDPNLPNYQKGFISLDFLVIQFYIINNFFIINNSMIIQQYFIDMLKTSKTIPSFLKNWIRKIFFYRVHAFNGFVFREQLGTLNPYRVHFWMVIGLLIQ